MVVGVAGAKASKYDALLLGALGAHRLDFESDLSRFVEGFPDAAILDSGAF